MNDFLPMTKRDVTQFEGAAKAWRQVYDRAKIGVDDLDVVEVHDCFTIAELLIYEAMGLAEKGQGASVIADGVSTKDGKLPVNPSGGLKSKGTQSVRRCFHACHGGDAGTRRCRCIADRWRRNRRRV